MIILKSWLNDWINLSNIDDKDISEALESLGFEIESTNLSKKLDLLIKGQEK